MSISTHSIYHEKNNQKIIAFINTQSITRITCGQFITEKSEIPLDIHPIDRIGSSHTFIIENAHRYISKKQPILRTFEDYLNTIEE